MLNRFEDRPPALGQVVIMPFQEKPGEFSSLGELQTVLIIKPNAGWSTPYFKFCGGMLREGESFEAAALRELEEETGVIGDTKCLHELCRIKKRQHSPNDGMFDVVFYVAFGCDFTHLKDPLFREVGDEAEEAMQAAFGDITTPNFSWEIPTKPGEYATMFAQHFVLAEEAIRVLEKQKTIA